MNYNKHGIMLGISGSWDQTSAPPGNLQPWVIAIAVNFPVLVSLLMGKNFARRTLKVNNIKSDMSVIMNLFFN